MRPHELRMAGVFCFPNTVSLTLPPRGVLVVTGENGAGKSALVEGLTFALFGKTLRGKRPWSGEEGSVSLWLRAEGSAPLEVERVQRKGKSSLRLRGTEHENKTKAQEELGARIGTTFEEWRRFNVFTATSASAFTRATDGERKVMVERLIGATGIQRAYQLALAVANKAETACAVAAARREGAMRALDTARATVKAAADALAACAAASEAVAQEEAWLAEAVAASEAADARVREAEAALALVARESPEVVALRQEVGALLVSMTAAEARHDEAHQLLGKVTTAAVCEACGRFVAPKDAKALMGEREAVCQQREATWREARDAHAAKAEELARVERAARAARELAQSNEREARAVAASAARARAIRARERSAAVAAGEATRVEREAALTRAVTAVESLEVALEEVSAALDSAEVEKNATRAVCAALSPAGVRAEFLANALAAITASANQWLATLAPTRPMRVLLTVRDDARDSLLLEVDGGGGGEGYEALSVGEQRRVDVALMLALAYCGANTTPAAGELPLVFDEVFDGLDAKGVAALADLAVGLAARRCVLVITHRADLADAIAQRPGVRQLVVADGRVSG